MKPISGRWRNEDGSVDYDAYIHSHDWDLKRNERIELDNHTCQICGTTERMLQVHHRSYKNLGNEPMDDLITVCSVCHEIISDIEHTRLDEKLVDGLHRLEFLKRLYESEYRAMVECVVSNAVVRHIDGIPEACGNYTTKLDPWISNIIEAIREERQHEIQIANVKSRSIARLITSGTFKKGRTYEQNVSEFTQSTRKRINNLPPIPRLACYASSD